MLKSEVDYTSSLCYLKISATKAISEIYQNIFHNKTQYSDSIIIEWDNKNIIDVFLSNIDFYSFSYKLGEYEIFIYGLAIFVFEIEDDKCYIHIYQDFKIQKTFVESTSDNVKKNSNYIQKFSAKELFGLEDQITLQKLNKLCISQYVSHEWNNFKLMNKLYEYHLQYQTFADIEWYKLFVRWDQNNYNIIELNSELKLLYPPEYQLSDRKLNVWLLMLHVARCSDITPWSYVLNDNKKTRNGKQHILSIITNDFTYEELEHNLEVESHTIIKSRRHAILNSFGAPPIEKLKLHRLKFKIAQIDQFDHFFIRKDIVNMNSYRTHSKSGLSIMYLQDHKQALWKKFSEKYPNKMYHIIFMTYLQGSRFIYQDDLDSFCLECNELKSKLNQHFYKIFNPVIKSD
ncbi:hypothetical protein C1645_816598 [Glomus cerebriforme]|uniref:Uncharacterized protein n=1 Tax=Glomus cerebriforme TaxID=658196 RepID=A0A397TEZ4_9GLOM|nr:hypothetical protein C1645_816598 [Glomus cerebriforme]